MITSFGLFFAGGSGWTRASLGVRLLRKPPIYRLVVLIHPFLHKNNQPQKRLGYLVIYLTLFGVIFLPVAKVILRLRRSDILFASSTAARQYHSAESRISLRSNRTRRKANRTEKSTCYCKCFFLGGSGWTRASLGVRLLRKPPIYRLVVLIHPFYIKITNRKSDWDT